MLQRRRMRGESRKMHVSRDFPFKLALPFMLCTPLVENGI
jgi:hypothetical protein